MPWTCPEGEVIHVIEYSAYAAALNRGSTDLVAEKYRLREENERLKTEIERYRLTVERLENQLMAYEERGWADE
jgi:uncharacterized protein YlxW (UPF0749 family)